ncbi:PhzF family phenazine biosynthesis protein [Ilumatobacter coccineus]|uniref:Putative phenazine biosynthesis protein n=1 Tax=Ilumatobacter coccineus (strain NBRC 103263 / KCTC 29153 / YM16-304) TaxID=1313172 RepID=A0A6C7E7J9_ILUCY|nr:PhzF family phenazine biosynthesis protein [Ilumatobacter coccineus]BAN02410.1 putative phenazine biosynthesis protein [Ilumatobacter coccineus YM16-304]
MQHGFSQVDVFASDGFSGNPLAVIHDADGITTDEMLRITAWTNLSEATFLLPPEHDEADYRVRIFCPGRELPFAGHPTLGTCAAWLAAGGVPKRSGRIVQECGAGLVPIRTDDGSLAFAAPPMTRTGPIDADLLAERLDQLGLTEADVVDAAWIDNGPGWMGILLGSAVDVLAVQLPATTVPGFDVGLIGPHPAGAECALEVRGLFADASGSVREDPVTGSLNASAAQWLIGSGRIEAPYVAAQGTAIGRRGRIHVEHDGDIWIGGQSIIKIQGTITI